MTSMPAKHTIQADPRLDPIFVERERNRFAGRAMGVYLKARAKTRQRSRRGGVVTRRSQEPDQGGRRELPPPGRGR